LLAASVTLAAAGQGVHLLLPAPYECCQHEIDGDGDGVTGDRCCPGRSAGTAGPPLVTALVAEANTLTALAGCPICQLLSAPQSVTCPACWMAVACSVPRHDDLGCEAAVSTSHSLARPRGPPHRDC
jgi:hypothetical protein